MTHGTDDAALLHRLVEVWHQEVADVLALLRALEPAEWSLPTDLPGWDVKAVAAHLAHLESELAGNPQPEVEVAPAPHVKGLMGEFTERGPVARRDWPVEQIIDELESSAAARHAALTQDPPTDASAPGPGFAGLIGWSWQTLLSNRPLDLWMHEQDIRRATGRPGGLDSPAAAHVIDVLGASLGFVLGKKAGATPGQSVVVEVTGPHPRVLAAEVGEDGRGRSVPPPADPTATLVMDLETLVVLGGGRRGPDTVDVTVRGDADLGRRVVENLAVTP